MAINDNSISLMVRTLITNANLYHYYENTTSLEVDRHFFQHHPEKDNHYISIGKQYLFSRQ